MSSKFRFKDYEFKYNPREFSITKERNLLKFIVPEQEHVIQDMGYEPTVISGVGELVGTNIMDEYVKIQDIFNDNSSGLLFIPNLSPINCYFNRLQITGRAGPKVLSYSFEFVENAKLSSTFSSTASKYYIATGGESLSQIAIKYGIDLDELALKNTDITDSENISQGVTVWL